MAWGSGARFGFIGTPKSDYTGGADQAVNSAIAITAARKRMGSREWMLMRHRRCQLVAMRDALTARGLKRREWRPWPPETP